MPRNEAPQALPFVQLGHIHAGRLASDGKLESVSSTSPGLMKLGQKGDDLKHLRGVRNARALRLRLDLRLRGDGEVHPDHVAL